MKKQASITLFPSAAEWSAMAVGGCGHGMVTATVPDTRPGKPTGATRSEMRPCDCGGAR